MITILACFLVFSVLVFFHELGHFLVAKATGMYVKEFAIGFGPKLFQKKYGETLYTLRLLPLGGFNNIAGMNLEKQDDTGRGFYSKSVGARMAVILAGSFMNLLIPFVILFGVFYVSGVDEVDTRPIIGQVLEEKPAFKAGLKPGDKVLMIDGKPVATWDEVMKGIINGHKEGIEFTVERGKTPKVIKVVPEIRKEIGVPFVGVSATIKKTPVSASRAWELSVSNVTHMTKAMIASLYDMVAGNNEVQLSGPVGIAKLTGRVANQGLSMLFKFMAILSLNLGVLNLLPLPALDGGHFVLLLIEAIDCKF